MTYRNKTKNLVQNKVIFKKLDAYVDLIELANMTTNLSGFKNDQLWQEGIFESIVCLETTISDYHSKQKILDIGAGAGFPSLPFKILHPEAELTIYEPRQKRVIFLENVSSKLNLKVKVVKTKAETMKTNLTYDIITARAVGSLKKLITIAWHLGHEKTKFIFIKGPNLTLELEEAQSLIQNLNIKFTIKKIKIEQKTISIITLFK